MGLALSCWRPSSEGMQHMENLQIKWPFCPEWLLPMTCSHCVLLRTYLCYLHSEVDVLHQETYYSSAEKGGPVAKGWGFPVSWQGCCIPNCYGWTLGWRLASQSWEVEQPIRAENKRGYKKRKNRNRSSQVQTAFTFQDKFQIPDCLVSRRPLRRALKMFTS